MGAPSTYMVAFGIYTAISVVNFGCILFHYNCQNQKTLSKVSLCHKEYNILQFMIECRMDMKEEFSSRTLNATMRCVNSKFNTTLDENCTSEFPTLTRIGLKMLSVAEYLSPGNISKGNTTQHQSSCEEIRNTQSSSGHMENTASKGSNDHPKDESRKSSNGHPHDKTTQPSSDHHQDKTTQPSSDLHQDKITQPSSDLHQDKITQLSSDLHQDKITQPSRDFSEVNRILTYLPIEAVIQFVETAVNTSMRYLPYEWQHFVMERSNAIVIIIIIIIILPLLVIEVYAWIKSIMWLWRGARRCIELLRQRFRVLWKRVKTGQGELVSHKPIISVPRISVVVISFNASNAPKHFEITKSLIEGERDYPLKKLLIRSPGDLDKLPRSKVALIYIDFNELNVILEEQNKKNPDQKKQLRSLTVQNILDTKEMEAIVIYCFDAASDKLDWGQHYAQKLITISTHPLLIKLEEKKCVFSINKKFTPFQKAALNKKLQGLIPK